MTQNKGVTLRNGKYVDPISGEVLDRWSDCADKKAKPPLEWWKINQIVDYAVTQRSAWEQLDERAAKDLLKREPLRQARTAATIGTDAHSVIEELAAGREVERTESNGWVLDAWFSFVDEFAVTVLESEAVAWNPGDGYAGRFDLMLTASLPRPTRETYELPDPATLIVDVKSSRSGIFSETAMQCCAYAMSPTLLREDGTREDMPEIHGTAALWVRPAGWALHPLRFDTEVYRAVKALAALQRFDSAVSAGAVASAINNGPIRRKK